MIRSRTALTLSSFLSMFFLGVGATIIGAAARNIGLTPQQIGLLMGVQNLGFMAAVVLSGALADTMDKTNILFVGSLLLAAAFATFYLWELFALNLAIMFFIGTGGGSYEGVTDAMLLDIHDRREGLFINVNHFFVTFGSLMITLYLIFLQMNWRLSLIQSGILVGALALFYLAARLERSGHGEEKLSARLGFLIREPRVIGLFAATVCAVGTELGTVGIMTTYLMEFNGMNQVTSKLGLLLFLAGVASGRLLVGFLSRNDQIPLLILLLFGSAALFLSGLFFLDLGASVYVLVYFSGMTISALLPLIITLAGISYPAHAGTVLGIIKIAIPIGGTLIPFLLSLLVRFSSFRVSLLLFPAVTAAGGLVMLLKMREMRSAIPS
ncbi:MAG: MFS transporter [Spirochaetota bacterium]